MTTSEGFVNIATFHPERRQAVGLHFRADLSRPDRQQAFARQVEQRTGILVCVNQLVLVDIKHNDRFRRVLDQSAVTFFIHFERVFFALPPGHVAQAEDKNPAVARR